MNMLCSLQNNNLQKERLNSEGQQFHKYQQNEQSPLTSTHWTDLAWDRHKNVAELNRFNKHIFHINI